jgi:hypothetical protein
MYFFTLCVLPTLKLSFLLKYSPHIHEFCICECLLQYIPRECCEFTRQNLPCCYIVAFKHTLSLSVTLPGYGMTWQRGALTLPWLSFVLRAFIMSEDSRMSYLLLIRKSWTEPDTSDVINQNTMMHTFILFILCWFFKCLYYVYIVQNNKRSYIRSK